MTGVDKNEGEISALVNDLIKEVDSGRAALEGAEKRIVHLEEGLRQVQQQLEGIAAAGQEQKVREVSAPIVPAPLEDMLQRSLSQIREEVKRQHTVVHQTRSYSLFGNHGGAEQFRVVANTVMKWIVILIAVTSLISVIKFLIHYQE